VAVIFKIVKMTKSFKMK